jgi:hypothetical protein
MSQQTAARQCDWDGSISPGECQNLATRHASWTLKGEGAGTRHRHFCAAHTTEIREFRGDVQDEPMSRCGVRCYQ